MRSEIIHPVDDFLDNLSQQRRLSEHTVNNYRRDLLQLADYIEQQNISDWTVLKSSQLRQFIAFLHRKGLSGKTIQRMLSATRSFY